MQVAQPTHTEPISTRRHDTIQVFRALAIMAVILAHTCPLGLMTVICRPFVNLCVPLFLFLSGYLTKLDNRDWGAVFKKRTIRVLIPYLIWTVLYTIEAGNIKKLPVNILTTGGAAHLYYIFVYIQFVLLTPLMGRLARSKYQFVGWLIAPIALALYKYIPLLTGHPLNFYVHTVCWNACLGWFTFYYLGLLLGNRIMVKKYSLTVLIVLYAVSILLQIGEGYAWMRLGGSNPGTVLKYSSLVTGTIACLIAYTILERGGLKKDYKWLVTVGNYSFGLYLSHVLIMHLLKLTPYYNALPYVVNTALVFAVSFGICYLGDQLLGKKVSRWFGFR